MLGTEEPVLSVEEGGQRSEDLKVKRTESLEVHHQHKHISEKRSHHPEEKHRGISAILGNSWVRLSVYMMACFFTSSIYYGWQDYKGIMVRGDAYAWKCSAAEAEGDEICDDQAKAIDYINLIASAFEYASAATGGVMLDHVGPRMSALVGEAMWGLGILLFAVSTQKAQLYIPGHILIGSAVNIVCFPSLSVIETFPAWHALMVGLVLGAQSLTVIPTALLAIMKKGNFSLRTIWLFYLLLVWLPVSALYVVTLPGKRNFQGILNEQRKEMDGEVQAALTKDSNAQENVDEVERGETTSTLIEKAKQTDDSAIETKPQFETRKASWREFFSNIATVEVILFSFCFLWLQHIYSYFPVVAETAISKQISKFYTYFLPTQAFWLIVVGLLCKWCPTLLVTLGMCVALEISMVISLFPSVNWLQYVSAVIVIITNCAVYEVKYTYVAEMFDPYNYGKLVGFFGVVGGVGAILGLATILIKPYWKCWTMFLCIIPVVTGVTIFLYSRQRQGITHKTRPVVVQNSSEADAELGSP